MASTIRGDDNFDTVGSSNTNTRLAKAWVVFNGTGTLAVLGNYGVSSVTDNAVGRYTDKLCYSLCKYKLLCYR